MLQLVAVNQGDLGSSVMWEQTAVLNAWKWQRASSKCVFNRESTAESVYIFLFGGFYF